LNPSCPVLKLSEWKTKELPGVTLSDQDRKLAAQLGGERGRVDVDELRTGVRVKAYSWVGIVRFENFEVHILPKLAGDNLKLVEMLAFTSGIDALRRNIGARQLRPEHSDHLLDLLALLLAQACERIVASGLLHDYVEQETDLPVLRGRLLADKQIRQRMGQINRLECRYDDLNSDILENQILAAALTACRTRVSQPAVRLRVRRLHMLFSATCSSAGLDLQEARGALIYNRLNQHYKQAHELAWLVLNGLGINDLLVSGPTRSFAFLLDMNRLFELFVFRFVEHILCDRAYRVHYQRRDRSIIWDITHKRPYTRVVPDLLIETDLPNPQRLVVDAKYKIYDERRLSTADIYQGFLYAYAYNSREATTPETLLLYPASRHGAPPVRLQIRSAAQRIGARIQAVGIHIPQALEEIQSGMPGPTTRFLLEVLEKSLPRLPVGERLQEEAAWSTI
jgi:5-methylcytosine-specific restriction enzyme subunit McrC